MAGNRSSVFIDGEAGTTGLGIRDRLRAVSEIEIKSLPDSHRKDPVARRDIMAEVDLVVLCLPDDAAKESTALAEGLGNDAPKLLDASTAHRVDPSWVYGFPEMLPGQSEKIARAAKVSNPGCYPTGAIALLRPLVDAGLLPPDYPISINAVSGYSGGGKSMIQAHDATHGPAFELYGLGLEHKHVAETQLYGGRSSCHPSDISARACWSRSRCIWTHCRANPPATICARCWRPISTAVPWSACNPRRPTASWSRRR